MNSLDFELGKRYHNFLSDIANATDTDTDAVQERLLELIQPEVVQHKPRKSPVFVVGSKVHPGYHRIIALRKMGMTVPQIVKETGVHRSRAYTILSQAGLTKASNQFVKRGSWKKKPKRKKEGSWSKKNSERTQQIRELAEAGNDVYQIAEKVGITPAGVWWQGRQHNIQLKKYKPGERSRIAAAQQP